MSGRRVVAACVLIACATSACLAEDRPPRPDPKTAFCDRLRERGDAAFTRKDLAFLDQEAERVERRDPRLADRLRKLAEQGRLEADIALYLKKGVSRKRRRKVEKLLDEKFPKIAVYEYISSPAALRAFRAEHTDNPELFGNVGQRDLPPYYLIDAGGESISEIVKRVTAEFPFVDRVITEDELRAKALRRLGALCDI